MLCGKETEFIIRNAREFATKMKLVLDEIDDEVVGVVKIEIGRLRDFVAI